MAPKINKSLVKANKVLEDKRLAAVATGSMIIICYYFIMIIK